MSVRCPSCGAAVAGKFCSSCGASVLGRSCTKCGHAIAPGAKFCPSCGTPAAGAVAGAPVAGVPGGRPILPLVIAGVALVALVLVIVLKSQGTAAPADGAAAAQAPFAGGAGGAGGDGTPPDLSTMTPRDQFDRLYNRVMTASEQGDTATVARFSPMAMIAYQNLPDVDADARYHMAMLKLHTGDITGAQALADSILKVQPGHLFGFVLNAGIARFQKDDAKVKKNYAAYLKALDAETKAARPEYQEHKTMLDSFTKTARSGGGN